MSAMSSALPMAPNPFDGPFRRRTSPEFAKPKRSLSGVMNAGHGPGGLNLKKAGVATYRSVSDYISRLYAAAAT